MGMKPAEELDPENASSEEAEQTPEIKVSLAGPSICNPLRSHQQISDSPPRIKLGIALPDILSIIGRSCKGEGAPECDKFGKYYRSLGPGEWGTSIDGTSKGRMAPFLVLCSRVPAKDPNIILFHDVSGLLGFARSISRTDRKT
ncbi:cytochrome c oxidase, subunit Vib family protein [Actinidia rufa]|uniref:Cytochrome c oxidase, subunit Vib family protein n=1 Tax=Actinidia rufa TaxID=165716 RepID=A0A7J0EHA1_9ERIC|nr:cytochrome c oxidase, subunit Vib family protein [Actinidia rufa]